MRFPLKNGHYLTISVGVYKELNGIKAHMSMPRLARNDV